MAYNVSSLNMVVLIGRLGADLDLTYTPNGTAKVNLNLATSVKWKDNDGYQKEKTEWHRCLAWGKTAELIGEWCKKGQMVNIIGKLQTRSWEKDGVKHYMTEVVIEQFTMLGKSGNGNSNPSQQTTSAPNAEKPKSEPVDHDEDDDLPF